MDKKVKNVAKIATGMAVGAGLGILFAPKKGSETREDIKNKYNEVKTKAGKVKKEDIVKYVDKKKKEIEKQLKDLDKEKVMGVVKTKTDSIKKTCDQMIEEAKKAGNEKMEEATREFKDKTVEVLKDITKKLEK